MDQQTMKPPIVIGWIARAEVCPCARSVVQSLGALSLRLEAAAAEDIALTLGLIDGGAAATAPAGVAGGPADSPEESN